MTHYDILIGGGTIIDGTGEDRFVGDIAIVDGKIAKIAPAIAADADLLIDAKGLIVAPGVIDVHTHYDAQIHWDPYCTSSGWHGTTSVVFSNCGFGFAPCRPEDNERYMRMMETTEQLPYEAQKRGLSWDWSTFPEWMEYLRGLPKGVNAGVYLPMNPLLCYVMGPDEAKSRAPTDDERARMRELFHEAMDAGAIGFSLTWLGAEGNSHVDFDHSPMPTDIMDPEVAYNLCDVLRERGEGVIQVAGEVAPNVRREIAEEMARRSGRPIIHNMTISVEGHPELHRDTMRWLDDVAEQGLSIKSHGVTYNFWQEFTAMDYNSWDAMPVFRTISLTGSRKAKVALVRDPAFRERMRKEFDSKEYAGNTTTTFEGLILHKAPGSKKFEGLTGRPLGDIAAQLAEPITDVFLDILSETEFEAVIKTVDSGGTNPDYVAEILRHPSVLPGISDGGAHLKTFCGGQWSTEMIVRLAREKQSMTLEELHHYMSGKTAAIFEIEERGLLREGYAADIMAYDFEKINYDYGNFDVRHDLPGGGWRRTTPAEGINYVLVNGVVTFVDGVCTQQTPGRLITNLRGNGRKAAA